MQTYILLILTTPGNVAGMKMPMDLFENFLPKGTDFKKLTKRDIVEITNLINNRPRKRLEWKTPLEVYRSRSVALEGLI